MGYHIASAVDVNCRRSMSVSEDPPTLRAAMRRLAGGVSLVTVGEGANRRGFTASSVTSLTLEPPCLLVCVNRQVSALPSILSRRRFGVSILDEAHASLAIRFSGLTGVTGAARFAEGRWTAAEPGVPLLEDALTGIACDLEDAIERHSHLILIGAVTAVHLDRPGIPLVYALGSYGRFEAETPAGAALDPDSALPRRRQASEQ